MKNPIKNLLLAIILMTTTASFAAVKTFNVVDYGAVDSQQIVSTEAIQSAIDAAHDAGGGRVLFPTGFYVTGTLFLKSNVELFFEFRATLMGAETLDHYPELPMGTEERNFQKSLFYVRDAENISIIGTANSAINGRGYNFRNSGQRPKLFRIEYCKNVKIQNITFQNSGSWCTLLQGCDQVYVDHLTVRNFNNPNNDGINFDGCSNVTLTNSSIQSGDDSICLKSSIPKACENITISNCNVSSNCAAFKLGTASGFTFRNISISDCNFFDCAKGTIKILMVDGGLIENLNINNINIDRCASPIFIRLGNRGRSYDVAVNQNYKQGAKPEGRPVGALRNVSITNFKGTAVSLDKAENGMMFTGIPNHYIENVRLENIDITYNGFGETDSNIVVPEDEARYPEQNFFGVLPSYGLYLRHVKGLQMKNVSLKLSSADNRPACYFDDVQDTSFSKLSLDVSDDVSEAIVRTNSVESVNIKGLKINKKLF